MEHSHGVTPSSGRVLVPGWALLAVECTSSKSAAESALPEAACENIFIKTNHLSERRAGTRRAQHNMQDMQYIMLDGLAHSDLQASSICGLAIESNFSSSDKVSLTYVAERISTSGVCLAGLLLLSARRFSCRLAPSPFARSSLFYLLALVLASGPANTESDGPANPAQSSSLCG
jgi:hypothetical protein